MHPLKLLNSNTMKKENWNKAVSKLLDKCGLSEKRKEEIRNGLENARSLRELATTNLAKQLSEEERVSWENLRETANDAIAYLIVIAGSGKLELQISLTTGQYSYVSEEIDIRQELEILTQNDLDDQPIS